jgi:hypothetical protein
MVLGGAGGQVLAGGRRAGGRGPGPGRQRAGAVLVLAGVGGGQRRPWAVGEGGWG